MDEALSATGIAQALTTRWLGREIHYFPEIDSTNRWLRQEASLRPDLSPGTLAVADFQTQGRGRQARRWEAPANTCLLFSLFLRPDWSPERANWLTMMAGLAAVDAVAAAAGLQIRLKWPNDLVIGTADGEWRKLGGILLEGVWQAGRLAQAVLGVGLNVNVPASALPTFPIPPTSILAETNQIVDRRTLLAALLRRLEIYYEAAVAGGSPQPAWESHLIWRNQWVQIQEGDTLLAAGIFIGTDSWGRLLLRDERDHIHTIAAGDVSLRPA
ncbi:MAG: hypothetical protein Fur0021_35560 [Candidatus Promineifilaceae bacterium]